MVNKWEQLNTEDDVVYFHKEQFEELHITQILFQFLNEIESLPLNHASMKKLLEDGFECDLLRPGKEWRTGKIKMLVSFEFCPDEPEIDEQPENEQLDTSQERSPLDDLREQLKEVEN